MRGALLTIVVGCSAMTHIEAEDELAPCHDFLSEYHNR
jgi:hypothetical protein